jgi:hypothetical protein
VDLSNDKKKIRPNYTEIIGATALGRPGAFRSGYVWCRNPAVAVILTTRRRTD